MLINGKELEIKQRANLRGADLQGADLRWADLRGADLRGADLRGANLEGENLQGANLQGADLRGADLEAANLRGADLRGADLRWADLRGADLRGANLQGADLQRADLRWADLHGAKNIPDYVHDETNILGEGELIGYKKLIGGTICKLLIPKEAKRSNATGRKCRAEFAVVLEGEGISQYDPTFKYKIGETVRPKTSFDEDRWNECGSGIHFYITCGEAERN